MQEKVYIGQNEKLQLLRWKFHLKYFTKYTQEYFYWANDQYFS